MEQKLNIISQEEQKFFIQDNNYIEYFFEIGIKPDIFKTITITSETTIESINSKLIPEIISKFPYFDKKIMAIDSKIIDFIFPKGFQAISCPKNPSPIFYSIIKDNPFRSSEYAYQYIGCLVIYESINIYH